MISAVRIPLGVSPLEYTFDILKEFDGGRVCAIVPTTRAVRQLAGGKLKTVEIFPIKEFTEYATNYNGVHLPKQLRPFYLKKAANALSKDDKIAIFRSENNLFLDNFTAFVQASSDIFSFYRELSAEMINADELAAAGKYTDYELQITVLERLWHNYLEIIKNDGYTEEWESYRTPSFREDFITRYDKFVFLIGGYLTKYELEQLRQTGGKKDIHLIFNYAGNRHAHHFLYEKHLNITLDDRPLPSLSNENTHIYSCSSMAAQLELITSLACQYNAQGNSFRTMAVIIPDESVKSYFLRVDPYNLFDITSNENIDSAEFLQLFKNILSLRANFKFFDSAYAEINDILKIFMQPIVYSLAGVKDTVQKYKKSLSEGKIYLPFDDVKKELFFKDYCNSFFSMDEMITPRDAVKHIKTFISNVSSIIPENELNIIHRVTENLDKLYAIYTPIKDTIHYKDAFELILSEISNIKIPTPKGKIPVMGILESRNLNFNIVFIPAMNDNLFPPTSKKDIFLNTEIRQSLDLPTIADRESLMKNYLLQIMERSKLNVILYSSASSAQNKSRFLEEITVYGNITEKSYSPSEITLFKSNNIYFSKNDSINIDKNDNILKKLSRFTYSATSLNTYLKCPLSFYFQFVKNVSPEPTPEKSLSSLKIGNAFHKALERLNKEAILPGNKNYRKVFKYEFSKRLMKTDAFKFNATEQFKAELSADVIDIIAERELERLTQGWQLKYTERNIDLKYNGYNLKGFIDRIDSKDNCHEIIDYKFKSNLPKNDKPFTREKSTDLQMPLYALLFELDEGVIPENLYYFDLKQTINLINAFNMEYYDEFKADFLDLLNEINSDNTPFYQTNKADSCKNCPYSGICGRNS